MPKKIKYCFVLLRRSFQLKELWLWKELENDLKILEELENEEVPTHIREARINEMRMKAREANIINEIKNANYQ